MKKIILLLLTVAMTLSLAACGGAKTDTKGETESYKITYNKNEGNTDNMENYQFLGVDYSGMINADSRMYIDLTLNLDGLENYELIGDCYVIEAGERQEVDDVSGIGMTWIMTAKGTYVDNEDGTISTSKATKAELKVETDTYSSQLKDAIKFEMDGSSEDGEWSSEDFPELLDYIPETVFIVKDGAIVSYENPNAAEEEDIEDSSAKAAGEIAIAIPSDDQGTAFNLCTDGTCAFVFESYDITDPGTYTYTDGILTITDKNGVVTTSTIDGDNLKFHYVYSDNEQLTGDYTVAIADIDTALNESK